MRYIQNCLNAVFTGSEFQSITLIELTRMAVVEVKDLLIF